MRSDRFDQYTINFTRSAFPLLKLSYVISQIYNINRLVRWNIFFFSVKILLHN